MWFQQYGAICNTKRINVQLQQWVISWGVYVYPRSILFNAYLREVLKSKLYANKPTTTHALKQEIKPSFNENRIHVTFVQKSNKRLRNKCRVCHEIIKKCIYFFSYIIFQYFMYFLNLFDTVKIITFKLI